MGTANRRGDSRLAWGEYQDYTLQDYGPYTRPTDPPVSMGVWTTASSSAVGVFSIFAMIGVCVLLARAALKKIAVDGSKYLSPIEDEERPMKGKRGWGGLEEDEQPTRTSTPESAEHPAKVRDMPSALEKGDLPTKQSSRSTPALPAYFPKDLEKTPLVEDTHKPGKRTKAVERSSTLGSLHAEALPTKASLDYEKLSVRELKQRLAAAGVSTNGAVEVSDLVELLREHDAEQSQRAQPGPPSFYPDGSPTRKGNAAKPPPPTLFPDGTVNGNRAAGAAQGAASPSQSKSSGESKSSGSPAGRTPNRRSTGAAAVKPNRMPSQPPPLMGSPPKARASESEDGSVLSAGQISAPISSKGTTVRSGGSGRNSRKERKVAPRPSDKGRTLTEMY